MRAFLEYMVIPFAHAGSTVEGADCFGLLRLFYQREFSIQLPELEFSYAKDWWKANNYLLDLYSNFGFVPVARASKLGDLIFFKNSYKHPGHIGIALDEERFLHMTEEGCATNCYAYGAWCRQAHSFYRHTSQL